MKVCGKCKEEKPYSDFNSCKANKTDGLQLWCRVCTKEYRKKYRKRKPNADKEYYIKNKDRISKRAKIYREINADSIKETKERYKKNNSDKIKESNKRYYQKNKERLLDQKKRLNRPLKPKLTKIYKREFKSWESMKQRCLNPNAPNYKYYGARGIKVCDRWLESFGSFLEDMGKRPENKTLDRIDNDGNYEPGNCRWSTPTEQALNRKRKE